MNNHDDYNEEIANDHELQELSRQLDRSVQKAMLDPVFRAGLLKKLLELQKRLTQGQDKTS